MSFPGLREVGYLPARAFGENLRVGSRRAAARRCRTLQEWLNSAPHAENLLGGRWRDLGIAFERGHMFGRDGVALWVMQFGRRH